MSDEQLIPNAVGRLDDVVEALAAGDVLKASNLLWKRGNDINRKRSIAAREYDKANHELSAVMDFSERLGADRDFAERVRVACGGGPKPADDGEIGLFTTIRHSRMFSGSQKKHDDHGK